MDDVTIVKDKNALRLRIHAPDYPDYLKRMVYLTSEKIPSRFFMKAYKKNKWNGEVNIISPITYTFSYGLLFEIIKVHKKNFPRHSISISNEVKRMFRGPEIKLNFNELDKHEPRYYQKEAVETALKMKCGIIRSATASGKSMVISYILYALLKNYKITKVKNCLLLVPRVELVEQFYNDMLDYGFPETLLGRVYEGHDEYDKRIVIATWQTIKNKTNKVLNRDAILWDETHEVKATVLKRILRNLKNAKYRLGFTGTMHDNRLDNLNCMSYLGPVLKDYPAGLLAEQDFIAKCTVHIHEIEYDRIFNESMTYHDIRNAIFTEEKRNNLIIDIVSNVDHNILVLVEKVKKEGNILLDILKNDERLKNKTIVFLSGKDDANTTRAHWKQELSKQSNIVMIVTYGIYQLGLNIPNLKYILLASPSKSKIRVLQSIGRGLRKHENKKDGLTVYDIFDHIEYLDKHSRKRIQYYKKENFNIIKELVKP